MQLGFLFTPFKRAGQNQAVLLQIGVNAVPIHFVRNRNARRYIIRVQPDGAIRATVPRVGSITEARRFAERNVNWIATQLQNRHAQSAHPTIWQHGTEIMYRGAKVPLIVDPNPAGRVVQFGDQTVRVPDSANLRPAIERHLRQLATTEMAEQTWRLAKSHGLIVKRVTIRSQRSRWGSCSRRGTISLNWRLVQMPAFVQHYIISHELMHLRELNHSAQFWREVAAVCPEYRQAKLWSRQHRDWLQ